MKITVLDGYGLNPGDLSWDGLKSLGELTVYDRTPLSKVVERSLDSEVLMTNKTIITAEAIAQLPKLKYIGILATGINVVDVEAARTAGVTVTNIPAYSTMSVMQMVFALLLTITNRPEHYTNENRRGRWAESPDFIYLDFPLMELAGKRFGIVGYGNIGSHVAAVAQAMGMLVTVYTSRDASELPEGMEKATDLDSLFRESDVISLHCPLTPDTYHLVDTRRLSLMKPTSILINTGRGKLVDEEALARALNDEVIYGAGLDVLTQEPPAADNPLFSARNCFITPHIAWASFEARDRLMGITENNLRCFLEGSPVNVVS